MPIANFFRRPHYRSEATQFIDALKEARPELDAQQQYGRSLLWDKDIDHAQQAEIRAGAVKQKPYPYQTTPSQ